MPERIPNSAIASAEGLKFCGDELQLSGCSDEIFGCRYLDEISRNARTATD
ncbi:MAG: hypothetical protein GXY61_14540 [Lentisphaerae bacterium]|nr:hypothetical protein [Lentisphaerota bacterium]